MSTIIIDNQNIKNHFANIINSKNTLKIKKIIITAKSGKGKTSLLKYLAEQCLLNNIPTIYLDFKFLDITSELDFIDQLIYSLESFDENLRFEKYDTCIQEYYNKNGNEIIFKNIKVIQSNIGNITTPEHMAPNFIAKATSAFWFDYNKMLAKKKIILMLDSYEQTSEEMRKWINRFLLQRDLNRTDLYIIIASLDVAFYFNDIFFEDTKQYLLPERYELEEWFKFGKQINIFDTSIIKRCFNCYNGEPFKMCIALKPLGDFYER